MLNRTTLILGCTKVEGAPIMQKAYLDANEWQIAEINRGLTEIRDGQVTPHAEVRARWEAKETLSLPKITSLCLPTN